MAARRGMVAFLDAMLLRLFALFMFALARGWLRASVTLRRAGALSAERFWVELCRATRFNRLGVRAVAVWLRLTRD
jgi:hypothetical protein